MVVVVTTATLLSSEMATARGWLAGGSLREGDERGFITHSWWEGGKCERENINFHPVFEFNGTFDFYVGISINYNGLQIDIFEITRNGTSTWELVSTITVFQKTNGHGVNFALQSTRLNCAEQYSIEHIMYHTR